MLDLPERLEDFLQVLLADAYAGIGNEEIHGTIARLGRD
jgi:hypothetical protein